MTVRTDQPVRSGSLRFVAERRDHQPRSSQDSAEHIGSGFRAFTLAERPDLEAALVAADRAAYPAFLMHGAFADLWPSIYEEFPEYQLALLDSERDVVLAHGNSVPFRWDGRLGSLPDTATALAERARSARRMGIPVTALGALQAVVHVEHQGRGLSREVLEAMAAVAAERGLADLFAPVRPSEKALYRLTDTEDYVPWGRGDGLPHDPLMRVHHRLGAKPVGVPRAWATVTGSRSQWEEWTGMSLPQTGRYVVLGGLVPVRIEGEADHGSYEEPHVWMQYSIASDQ